MTIKWEVSDFQVCTSTSNNTKDTLYANNNMQVLVMVMVKAIDPTTGQPYSLTKTELDSIVLLDLNGQTQELGGAWRYKDSENEFDHNLDNSMSVESSPQNATQAPKAGFDKKDYWVSTNRVESKIIGAQIKQPDGNTISTNGVGAFDSSVVLTGVAPPTISFADLTLRQDTDTANGSSYDQDNYYLTIRNRQVRCLNGPTYYGSDPYLKRSIAFWNRPEDRTIFFMWQVGPRSQVDVGTRGKHTQITVNQEANAGCFTRMMMWNTHDERPGYTFDYPYYALDQCGNPSAPFYPYYSDHNTLYLHPS
ncbi:hypothetical protein BO82DRAFT_351059 [Aspergillus uvarum CBS 121591]|uniref:Uncharacterized protein n=1 Tax=Aspergillus uvarum CBS 121591 TaxID=1448315 RepID=A0A319CSC1_9EURO|nr:hypothetical protein BO82DRAFT_351059 [Aspergillus uvarum CBS 121591]PYH85737.1 hypothetical protein BO82DRAFT_351059 [Aspergillus uvarum CBS 121591]